MKFQLISPSLWLILAVLSGIAFMAIGCAPLPYIMINAIALGVALVMIRFMPCPQSAYSRAMFTISAISLLFAPLLIGPDIDGVRRWIGFGPVQLHSGMLMLPMLVALLPRLKPAYQLVTVALVCIAISCQPDRASAIALLFGTTAILFANRTKWSAVQTLFAVLAVCATLIQSDLLTPVRFVENVLFDVWQENLFTAAALSAALVVAIAAPALGNRLHVPMTATIGGFVIASLLGAYPTPLIGYGASSIIGFGLALAVGRSPR